MIEKLKDLPRGIDGVKAIGKISKEDYEQVFVPLLDEARREGRRIRFLYQLGPEFEGFTPGAAWEDAKIGLHFLRLFDGCAVVTDLVWIRELTRLAEFLMPCPVSYSITLSSQGPLIGCGRSPKVPPFLTGCSPKPA